MPDIKPVVQRQQPAVGIRRRARPFPIFHKHFIADAMQRPNHFKPSQKRVRALPLEYNKSHGLFSQDAGVTEFSVRSNLASLLAPVREPQIVLAALTPLRWLAVVGQVTATAVAAFAMHFRLPLGLIAVIIAITALSNLLLTSWMKLGRTPAWLAPATLLLDILLLTALLYLTGGPENPFAALYAVHVAMAVSVLGAGWSWIVVATIASCYGVLLKWHLPLVQGDRPLPAWASATGSWIALVLVSVLIAAFIGRVTWNLRQRERELATVRERAARSEQLAALTTLAAGAAHELHTPLGTIAVVAKELEHSCANAGQSGQTAAEDARLIRREVDRCRTILNRMRFDVGEEVSPRDQIHLPQMIARLRESLQEGEQERLKVQQSPDVERVCGPARALEQSLLVLLRNAFDASPHDRPVTLEIARNDGHVRFVVRDVGCGMSDQMLRRAGEPFFTTKEPGRGMGLGLFLVRLVAERCGADFKIESQVDQGTTCVFDLPEPGARDGDNR
jgi:two-component system, sensor histidine kinase RegB